MSPLRGFLTSFSCSLALLFVVHAAAGSVLVEEPEARIGNSDLSAFALTA